jgi:adenylate kinase
MKGINMKVCHIIRAVPGAGKSTLSKILAGENGTICEADNYMYEGDTYKFHPSKLGMAHAKCFEVFKEACENNVETIVVSNTNTTLREFNKYKKFAEACGYIVFVMILENRHDGTNVHDVPEESLHNMANKIMNSIKLV